MTRQEFLRSASFGLLRSAMPYLTTPLGDDELRRSAMVFAPHPDDETLGCGGTILRKRRAGAAMQLVFMTDGAASHAHLTSRAELKVTRRREALQAAEVLGLGAGQVSWLGLSDGELSLWREEAVLRVSELIQRHRPEQIILPYARGEHVDHVATHAIVYESIGRVGLAATLLEYPVWSWRHWRAMGWFPRELRASVSVHEVLAWKRLALERHVSQVRRRHPGWSTLGDIDQGEFLACLFQDHEYYRRVELRPVFRASSRTDPRSADR
jgi:LmbE family N-acetylglucosaminyl deacetylase